jgi:beta-lactamase regulating signal transducer with metallopeptidase domain
MLSLLLKMVLLQSTVGAIITLVLLLLKPVTKRIFGSRWQYYIWLCVLVIVILPPITISFPEISAVPDPELSQMELTETNKAPDTLYSAETNIIEDIPFRYKNVEVIQVLQISQYDLLIYVWLAGVAIFFLRNIISYLLFLRTISKHSKPISCSLLDSIKREKEIRSNIRIHCTPCINAPLILGFFQPIILLPEIEFTDESLRHILLHELTHHKRHDLWYKWFAMIVNAIHWFNPIIYLLVRQMNEECEISCDFAVAEGMNIEERKSYMSTILLIMAKNKMSSPAMVSAMSCDKRQIKKRFEMLNKERRRNKFMSLLSFITASIIFGTTLFAGSSLAAHAQDGLEIWTENQAYFRDGIQFSVNVSGKNVPSWVLEDVAGGDGNIYVTVKRVQIRDVKGQVGDYAILELKGAKGTTKLFSIAASGIRKINSNNDSSKVIPELFNNAYVSDYSFYESTNVIEAKNPGKGKNVNVDFVFSENETLTAVYMGFWIANKFDNFSLLEHFENRKYMPVKADSDSIAFIGDFQKDYIHWVKELTTLGYFTFFETDFVNKTVAGINVAVDSASSKGVTLKASVSHSEVKSYKIYVYNKDEQMISFKGDRETPPDSFSLEPIRYRYTTGVYEDIPQNQFVSGETYRVDIVLFDREQKVIYRQREYVNIP